MSMNSGKQSRLTAWVSSSKRPKDEPLAAAAATTATADQPAARTVAAVLRCPKDAPKRANVSLPGLYVFDDFITEEEEAALLAYLDRPVRAADAGAAGGPVDPRSNWKLSAFNGPHYGQRWGVRIDYAKRQLLPAETPLPTEFDCVVDKMKAGTFAPLRAFVPNEANAISYHRALGHFLSDHFDDRRFSGELLANLTLAGGCYMHYTNGKAPAVRVQLKRRSLQVVTGASRYNYKHGISNDELLDPRRVSITFRHSDTRA